MTKSFCCKGLQSALKRHISVTKKHESNKSLSCFLSYNRASHFRTVLRTETGPFFAAFAEYLNDSSLDSRQIYFVNQIVEYIVHNGMMKDLSVLQETPCTDKGSVVARFSELSYKIYWLMLRYQSVFIDPLDHLANPQPKSHKAVIAKLKGNIPLTQEDVAALERILWSEIGSKEDYEAACGQKPLGEFVREIVGLDMNVIEIFQCFVHVSYLLSARHNSTVCGK